MGLACPLEFPIQAAHWLSKLTQFYLPLNLLPLMLLRPLRLVLLTDTLRRARIQTHISLVSVIWAFERGSDRLRWRTASLAALARSRTPLSAPIVDDVGPAVEPLRRQRRRRRRQHRQ